MIMNQRNRAFIKLKKEKRKISWINLKLRSEETSGDLIKKLITYWICLMIPSKVIFIILPNG
jgi:hypothetical protein